MLGKLKILVDNGQIQSKPYTFIYYDKDEWHYVGNLTIYARCDYENSEFLK